MDALDALQSSEGFKAGPEPSLLKVQINAKRLCQRYNATDPDDQAGRQEILHELLGTCDDKTIIEPDFRCDYGFNIHFRGFAFVNYNCVFLDTSPITIGDGVFVGPGTCLACAGHALDPDQRAHGWQTSAPITIGDGVWIGANVTIGAGVTIGSGSVIGAGSVVTRSIPAGVVARGVPCKVTRSLSSQDRIDPSELSFGNSAGYGPMEEGASQESSR